MGFNMLNYINPSFSLQHLAIKQVAVQSQGLSLTHSLQAYSIVKGYITPEKEEAGKKKLEPLLQCQHLVNKLIFEYKLNIEFLRAVMEDGVITLQGIADSSVLVERALKISSVEFPNYTIKSAISVVQDFKPYS